MAWPILLQNLISSLQGIVDHAMVGHFVGYIGNAAIGVSWQIFLVVVVFVNSLYTGMSILVARYAGANEPREVSRVVYQAFLVSVLLALLVLAPFGYLFSPKLLQLANAAPEVQIEALSYLRILFVFVPGMLIFFMLGGALRAAGDPKTALRLGVLLTILNLTLNFVFIRGLGPVPAFGTRGAAMGTVLAGFLVALVALYLLLKDRLVIRFSAKLDLRPDWAVIRTLLRFGLPMGFHAIAINLGALILMSYVGTLEESAQAQAVYSVVYIQVFSLIQWTGIALLAATATVVGQNLGARQTPRAEMVPRSAVALGLSLALPVGVVFLSMPAPLLGLFGLQGAAIVALGKPLLAYLSFASLCLIVAAAYTGALQGAGDTRSPLYIALLTQIAVPVLLCAVLSAVRGLSPNDIWLAIVLAHLTRAVLSFARFRQGRWRFIEVAVAPANR